MKKAFSWIVVVMLLLSLTGLSACKKGKEEAAMAPITYTISAAAREMPTSAVQIPLGDYTFDSFFDGREYIKVSVTREEVTYYGVLDGEGNVVIPANYKSITLNGDFFLAEGTLENALYHVFSRTGRELRSSDAKLTATDVGGGTVSITEGGYVYLYDESGEELIEGSSLDDSYAFSACGNYLLATSSKRNKTFLFDRRGGLRQSFLGTENTEYSVHYAGGDDFVVILNETVSASESHTVEIKKSGETVCLRQAVNVRNVATGERRTIALDRAVLSLSDRYSVGVSEEGRRRYPLSDGCFCLCYYVTSGKVTDGSYAYCVTDRSLNVLKEMPESISPLRSLEEGYAACAGASGAIYLFNEDLDVVLRIEDAVYQSVSYSCGVICASKLSDGKRVMGCLNREGKVVVPFEYDVISEFVGGKAYAAKNGEVYLIDRTGNATSLGILSYDSYWYWYGFCEIREEEGTHVGLASYDGKVLIPADYDAFGAETILPDRIFVAMVIGPRTDLFVLR